MRYKGTTVIPICEYPEDVLSRNRTQLKLLIFGLVFDKRSNLWKRRARDLL